MATLIGLSITTTYAGGPDYYQGRGRIAVSSDGNRHDNDDMNATKMTLMILAKAGLRDQTVVYTYADHIWSSESNDLEIMRRSAEETGQRFGFDRCRFIAAVEDPEAAYNAMRDEILKSTSENPLFIIAAGPMQVVGTAIERAAEVNPLSLSHITLISHSDWNNRHSDDPYKNEPQHSGWTWDELKEAYGDRVNFKKILDQNGTSGGGPNKSKDKFYAPDWQAWEWMNNSDDENLRWVYNHDEIKCGPDYSDAGMAYYLCADLDGVRGDEHGTYQKLEQWVATKSVKEQTKIKPSKVKVGDVSVGEDFIAIEADASITPLGKGWRLVKSGDKDYTQICGTMQAVNGTYIEYMSGTVNGAGVDVGQDVLTYKFTPKSSGEYYLTGRMAQQLNQADGVARTDQCNDVFVKLEGDYTSASEASQEILGSWNKWFGRGFNAWGAFTMLDVQHKKYKPIYNLKAGVEYTLYISGRSTGVCIDYILLSKAPVIVTGRKDLSTHNDVRLRPQFGGKK